MRWELPEYEIGAEDSAPIVIGGIGGSGTRLVTQILQHEGVSFGGVMNEELDNLWFSLLFVRRTILLKPLDDVRRLAWLFTNAMRSGLPIPEVLFPLLNEAARYDRGPALTKAVLEQARDSMMNPPLLSSSTPWGWKQPNTHVMVPLLSRCFPAMKYVYVVRNGLDMAFSDNQNQLKYFWGDLLLEGDTSPSPCNALRYWVASYKRISGDAALLGDRLYILDYDLLCKKPAEQIQRLNRFLGLEVDAKLLQSAAGSVSIPESTGRYQQLDCSQFYPEDVDFVRALGFEIAI